MKKIKIAQIGINVHSHSNEIFGSICKQSDLFEVVGYVLPENEKERIPNKYNKLKGYEELIGIMKNTGKVFHTGYMYRYNPYIQELIEQVKAGELGYIISVEAQMNCTHPKDTRQWLECLPDGMMFYLGCHLVDLIMQI